MYKTFKFSIFPLRKIYEPVGYNKQVGNFLSTCLIFIAMNNSGSRKIFSPYLMFYYLYESKIDYQL